MNNTGINVFSTVPDCMQLSWSQQFLLLSVSGSVRLNSCFVFYIRILHFSENKILATWLKAPKMTTKNASCTVEVYELYTIAEVL
jgi:hypothetical protein